MDPNLEHRIQVLEQKIDKMYAAVEKLRKYFLWTLVATVVTIVIPMIAAAIMIPIMMNTYSSMLTGL